MFRKLTLVVFGLLLGSCATTDINHDVKVALTSNNQIKQTLSRAAIMPTKEELSGDKLRVLVLNPKEESLLAKQSNSGAAMVGSLAGLLHSAGVAVVDRSMATKVKDEILAYESTGYYNSTSFELVDISILPTISSATFSHTFSEGYTSKDKKGNSYYTPPYCRFKAKVSGSAKSYRLPGVKVISTVKLDGVTSISRETRSSSCSISKQERLGMVAQAAEQSIRNYKQVIKNAFAPKGYVIQYKIFDGTHYIQISLGSDKQLLEGSSIEFITLIKNINDLTGEYTQSKLPLGEGEVTSLIQEKSAWVVVDEDVAQKLHLGDVAKVKFKNSFMDHLNNSSQFFQRF